MNTTTTIRTRFSRCLAHNLFAVLMVAGIGVAGVANTDVIYAERPLAEGSSLTPFECEPVPAGEFPSSAIVRRTGGGTRQVTRPALVSKAFDVAVGVRSWPGVDGIELCR